MVTCPKCGRESSAVTAHCDFCGADLTKTAPVDGRNPFGESSPYTSPLAAPQPPTGLPEEDLAIRMLIPIGRSPYAVIAGYLGLLSLGFCFLGPFAVLFGILALRDIKRNPKNTGIPRAVIGIVFGTIGTLGLALAILALVFG